MFYDAFQRTSLLFVGTCLNSSITSSTLISPRSSTLVQQIKTIAFRVVAGTVWRLYVDFLKFMLTVHGWTRRLRNIVFGRRHDAGPGQVCRPTGAFRRTRPLRPAVVSGARIRCYCTLLYDGRGTAFVPQEFRARTNDVSTLFSLPPRKHTLERGFIGKTQ